MPVAPDLRENLAAMLADFHRTTGDGRYARAASALMGSRPGRRPIDDTKALEHARSLLAAGLADSPHEASTMVAKLSPTFQSVDSTRDRIRRKLRTIRT
jgi:hypothetical protein